MINTTIRIINATTNIQMTVKKKNQKNINYDKNDHINDKSNWTHKRNNTKKHNNKINNHNDNNDNTMKK